MSGVPEPAWLSDPWTDPRRSQPGAPIRIVAANIQAASDPARGRTFPLSCRLITLHFPASSTVFAESEVGHQWPSGASSGASLDFSVCPEYTHKQRIVAPIRRFAVPSVL